MATNLSNNFHPLPDSVQSPINIKVLQSLLINHSDKSLVNFILEGFRFGFSIGFAGNISSDPVRNLLSARNNPEAVSKAIEKELIRGHTSGLFLYPPLAPLHCSPLGAVPKKDGSHRIILNLSSPKGSSVNEGIPKEEYSVKFSSFDDAVDMVRSLGHGAFMAKLDIKHAFRLCPVRLQDWHLLGYFWQGHYFIDTRLPFGCRSSPFIFNQFASILLWILINVCGIALILHYLDDFFLCGKTASCVKNNMTLFIKIFADLGVPLAPEKIFGPLKVLTYLGIEIDTDAELVRLPPEKFEAIKTQLLEWSGKKKCTKRELLSLIGTLSFAAKVVKPGRMFLRRLIELSTTVSSLNHHIDLNNEARADINWWSEFLPTWNGIALFQQNLTTSHSIQLFTDASKAGLGAVYNKAWFSIPWPINSHHINFLELFAIVAATFTWGGEWANKQILFFTDNQAITMIWQTGTCKDKDMMRLIRALFLFTAKNNINLLMRHIPGSINVSADYLSRLQVKKFRAIRRDADVNPTSPPLAIWQLFDSNGHI